MTEQEWLTCSHPEPMLKFLRDQATERKLRLFACACVRRILALTSNADSGWAVGVAERQADGLASEAEWAAGVDIATATANDDQQPDLAVEALFLSWAGGGTELASVAADCGRSAVRDVAWSAVSPPARPHRDAGKAAGRMAARREQVAAAAETAEREAQAALARDVFGNPYRPTALGSAWQTPTVLLLAQAGYEEQQFPSGHLDPARLSILADALEDAGCDNADILSHLRGPGPHVRGCWALDLILGKS